MQVWGTVDDQMQVRTRTNTWHSEYTHARTHAQEYTTFRCICYMYDNGSCCQGRPSLLTRTKHSFLSSDFPLPTTTSQDDWSTVDRIKKRNNYYRNFKSNLSVKCLHRRFRLYCLPVLLYGLCLADNELHILSAKINESFSLKLQRSISATCDLGAAVEQTIITAAEIRIKD